MYDFMTPELTSFGEEIRKHHIGPLWEDIYNLVRKTPDIAAIPYLWKGKSLMQRVLRSGELITPERGGERRVLYLQNPGLNRVGAATPTLYVGVQLLLPGEIAPSHRHTQGAIRFIMTGSGAYSVVDGQKVYMEKGDFILTPPWSWHDHGHEGTEPMLWLDGLDIPLVELLNASLMQPYLHKTQPVTEVIRGDQISGGLRPLRQKRQPYPSPTTSYPWRQTYKALNEQVDGDPFDGIAVMYVNPNNGQTADRRIGAVMQRFIPSMQTKAHRHMSSAIYYVHQGQGYSVMDGQRFDWAAGDIFIVPGWSFHEHHAEGPEDAYLFSLNDEPVFEALGLQVFEELPQGNQTIARVFEPTLS